MCSPFMVLFSFHRTIDSTISKFDHAEDLAALLPFCYISFRKSNSSSTEMMISGTVSPHKRERRKIGTYKLILWENTLKDRNRKQTDFFPSSYEMAHFIK